MGHSPIYEPKYASLSKIKEGFVMLPLPPLPYPPSLQLYALKLNHGQIGNKNWGAIGNVRGNRLGTWGNMLGIWWEHLGTWWEQSWTTLGTENDREPPPTPKNQKPEEKTKSPQPSHWVHEMSISKTVCHHFQPGLVPPLETGPTY
jgi:hypothetical protein